MIFFSVQFYNIVFRGFAPFISTGGLVIKKIMEELEIKDGAKVYELGCGKAGFLSAAEKKNPKADFTGVEYSSMPYVMARMQLSLIKSKIKIIKQNFFETNLRDADIIYCFLNIKTMVELEKKFKAECKPGTIIVSYMFTLPNTPLLKKLDISKNDKVYFYKI